MGLSPGQCLGSQWTNYWQSEQAYPAGTAFYVTIAPGTFQDAAGNPYAGISDTTTLNFTTMEQGDTTPPTVTGWRGFNPDTGAYSGAPWVRFSEMIQGGCSFYLAESPDAAPSESIDGGTRLGYNREGPNGPYSETQGSVSSSKATPGYWENNAWHYRDWWWIFPENPSCTDLAGNALPAQVVAIPTPPPNPNKPNLSAPVVASVGSTSVNISIPSMPAGFAGTQWGLSFNVSVETTPLPGNQSPGANAVQYCTWTFDNTPWNGEFTQACVGGDDNGTTVDLEPATTYYAYLYFTSTRGGSRSPVTSFTTLNADGSIAGAEMPVLAAPTIAALPEGSTVGEPDGHGFRHLTPSKPEGFDNFGEYMGFAFLPSSTTPGNSCSDCLWGSGGHYWDYNSSVWDAGWWESAYSDDATPGATYYLRWYITHATSGEYSWSPSTAFSIPILP